MQKYKLFTSESVTEGHPDKLADQISDGILDAVLTDDSCARVAVEALLTKGKAFIAGEITTSAQVDYEKVAREITCEVGYSSCQVGFDGCGADVTVAINTQSPDIACGVDTGGAGDQGMMFGYACNETKELMPLPITLAHRITQELTSIRKNSCGLGLRPDGKSQVTIAYVDGKPHHIDTIVVSTQHDPNMEQADVKKVVDEKILVPLLDEFKMYVTDDIKFHVNPTGVFVTGGPEGDTGLTGRKIIVDTYGGMARHGGGCFSGKDPTKVDRSAAYMARFVAKNIVAAGLAERCEIQVAYAIGVAQPVSVRVDTFGTSKMPESEIEDLVMEKFDLTPGGIINYLNLRRPIYRETAKNGHFGNPAFPWERTGAL